MKSRHILIVAEAGDNHNGDPALAYRLIDVAADVRADYVKFQTFQAEAVVSKNTALAPYQAREDGACQTQLDLIKKLELPFSCFQKLKLYAEQKGIGFMSSPFDLQSIDFLSSLGVEMFKIPSGEITNLPYLEKIAALNKPLILSTGMSSLCDIECALKVLRDFCPAEPQIVLLHCNSHYPTPYDDANLLAIRTLKRVFNLDVGYSDHTLGFEAAVAAAALGATMIEKHFTLDRNMSGPDHKASLEPSELKAMVKAIRNVEKAMGDGVKRVTPSEQANMEAARKSIVAARTIQKGELFTPGNLSVKRPGTGLTPMRWHDVLGRSAKRTFVEDELIEI